jgi:hypothetical protein
VLAEIDPPGPLHYLIESEGFQVVGCASNDADLARVLAHVQPDVIVLDADVSATSALVAREEAPSSELIVLWPDGVQLPSGAERVHPRLVYQDLGPAIRHAADDRRARHPTVVELEVDDLDAQPPRPASVAIASSTAQRTSTRVLVGTAALIALIVVTMGASFALEGRSGSPQPTPVRTIEASPSTTEGPISGATSPPSRTGDPRPAVQASCAPDAKTDRKTPNEHAAASARGALSTCQGGGRENRPPHQHDNHRGNGSTTAQGNAHAKDGGTANAKGGGTANGKTEGGSPQRPPRAHPSEPPATPGGARNGPPG